MRKGLIYKIIRAILLTLGTFNIIYPLLWMVGSSLKDDNDIKANMYSIIPKNIAFINYPDAWMAANLGSHSINSIIITGTSLIMILLFSYLASYSLAKIKFKGRQVIMTVFVAMMLVPLGQVVMIPQYRLERLLNLVNTRQGVILLYINGGIPLSIFLLTAFLEKIPVELEEAALIDGCSRLRLIFQIMLPLTKPGLATVIIFQFMGIWNDFFTPLIYLQDESVRTITQGLQNFSHLWGLVDYNKLFAALTIVNMPVVVIYIIFQKQFISGLTAGAIKL